MTVPTDGGTVVRSRLFIKYVVLFVAVVSLTLIANAVFDVYFSYQEQKASLVRIQREQAEAAAGKIGQFISEIESQVGWTTRLPWSASTLEYRIFTIGPDGHFTGVPKIAEFADDKEVVEEARRTANGADTEIWNLERLVVTLRGGHFLNKTAKRVSGASYSQNA